MVDGGGLCFRAWVNAERKMPKMAPRVPPMSSMEAMVLYSTASREPFFAVPAARLARIAVAC